MRSASLLLVVPLALGCSAVSAPDGSASSDLSAAQAPRYREVERVFDRLDEADVSGCRRTFRFLNGNWVDCVVDLDASAFPLQQLAHETLPIRSFSFPTAEPEVTFDVRVEEVTTWSPLPMTRLFVSATYSKAGQVTIHQLPAEYYSYDRFVSFVSKSFEKLSRDASYGSRMIALTGPGFEHPLATDTIVGDLFVARRRVSLDAAACKSSYFDGMSDSWPEPDHWISYCSVRTGGSRKTLPLTNEHWSARLATLANTDPVVVRIKEGGGKTPTVTIHYGEGGYTIDLAVIDDASGEPDDASIPWERAEGWIAKALAQVREVTWPILLNESERESLRDGERIEGRLVLRGRKMDVE